MNVIEIIDKLYKLNDCSDEELLFILSNITDVEKRYLFEKSNDVRQKWYKKDVYLRGLIELTNYCKNDCLYCGIRKSNKLAKRYRLKEEEVLECVDVGDGLGYKTIVLQGGEDTYYTDDVLESIIMKIKAKYPENVVTLSLGERSYNSYKRLYDAGAERYLLRHETANEELYNKIHPGANFKNRINCLKNLKEIGYQVGAGFMVGIPGQSKEDLVKDLRFLKDFNPHMCGIGPFIPHKDTPFGDQKSGTLDETILLLGIIRLLLPKVLLPATTALSTIAKDGRQKGIKVGANVIMPNLSPKNVRDKYSLYNGKVHSNLEAAECKNDIENELNKIGYRITIGRGDYPLLDR
ncbi:MAG: [FeFe] hydrogenase H-cluster radical SAM maturase HydE [Clostridium sp.]|nr:[FeFe] hydrogenase H-cluster radical SAM maturase HydE [Clostridium sp.]